MKMILLACGVIMSLVTLSIAAQQNDGTGLVVERVWARASTGATGAVYLSISNHGTAPDRLLAVRTPMAEKAELHESKMENGVMKMRPLGPITIGPSQSAVLKPGADHVMLMGLKQPLKQGETFPLTLTFEKAGDIQVNVKIEGAGAMGADAMDHGPMQGMDHDRMK